MKAQATKTVNIISREVIRLTGLVLYTILSSDGITKYFATYKAGEVYCECAGFNGRYHKCYHTDYIVSQEKEIAGASGSIGAAMADADTALRRHIAEAAVAGDRTYNDVIDAAYAERGAEIATKKVEYRIAHRGGYYPQHRYPGEKWEDFGYQMRFDALWEAQQHLTNTYNIENPEVVEEATYCSCCGKLSKRDVCYHCTTGR